MCSPTPASTCAVSPQPPLGARDLFCLRQLRRYGQCHQASEGSAEISKIGPGGLREARSRFEPRSLLRSLGFRDFRTYPLFTYQYLSHYRAQKQRGSLFRLCLSLWSGLMVRVQAGVWLREVQGGWVGVILGRIRRGVLVSSCLYGGRLMFLVGCMNTNWTRCSLVCVFRASEGMRGEWCLEVRQRNTRACP